MKKTYFLFYGIVLVHNWCNAQNLPSIQTDRPDQTECPFIVPVHFVQSENGFSIRENKNNSSEITTPTVLTRLGISANFELRLITEFVLNKNNFEDKLGLHPVLIGFKTKLFEEKGILPSTAFIGHIEFPKTGSMVYQTTYYAPEFRFSMQHTISDRQSLGYNIGAEWNGETPEPTFIYTLTTGYSFTETIGGYIELYGFVPQIDRPNHQCAAGLTYLFNPHHQLDFSGGFGLSKMASKYYIAVGYSFRFKI